MNVNLELIMCLIGNLFRIYIINYFFQIFLQEEDEKKGRWLRILYCALYFLVNSGVVFYWNAPPKMIIMTNIVGCTLLAWSYRGHWKDSVYAIVIVITMNIICEDMVYYFLSNLQIGYIKSLSILAANLLFFMIALLLKKVINFKQGQEITLFEWTAVVLVPVCSVFISVIALDKCKDEKIVVIGGTCLILINIFLFFLLDRIQRLNCRQQYLGLLEQQNQVYESQIKLLRASEEKVLAIKHDIKNHFLALEQLAEQNHCSQIKTYIHSLAPSIDLQKQIVSTGNPIIDGFLNMKLNEAITYGAQVETDVKISKNLPIDLNHISIILGNLLDNALRALKNCRKDDKLLAVTMYQEPGKLFMKIRNVHSETICKFGSVFKTTKKRKQGHGIGLKNVQRVLDEYCGQMEIEYTDDIFIVKLVMFI